MTMIEKVARAICKSRFLNGGNEDDDGWDDAPKHVRDGYLHEARVAIEAMREPTKEMIEVGYTEINNNIDSWNYESDSGYAVEDIAPTVTWRAMIEVALKDEGA